MLGKKAGVQLKVARDLLVEQHTCMGNALHRRIIAGRSVVMIKGEHISHPSNTEKLKRLRFAELDVDYHKQLRALKRIIKNGRIHFGDQLKHK